MTGKQAEARRLALGLTREQLAVKVGVTGPTIFRWEKEMMKPHPILRARWEKALRNGKAVS